MKLLLIISTASFLTLHLEIILFDNYLDEINSSLNFISIHASKTYSNYQ